MASLGVNEKVLEQWHDEEVEYFRTLGKEPEWDVHAMAYVELLQGLRNLEYVLPRQYHLPLGSFRFSARHENASTDFLNSTPVDYTFTSSASPADDGHLYAVNLSQTRKKETERHHLAERRDSILREVIATEVKMGIVNHWQPSNPEYLKTAGYMSRRKYHVALDNLQRLVVLRLFELHKLNLSQTGTYLYHCTFNVALIFMIQGMIPNASSHCQVTSDSVQGN